MDKIVSTLADNQQRSASPLRPASPERPVTLAKQQTAIHVSPQPQSINGKSATNSPIKSVGNVSPSRSQATSSPKPVQAQAQKNILQKKSADSLKNTLEVEEPRDISLSENMSHMSMEVNTTGTRSNQDPIENMEFDEITDDANGNGDLLDDDELNELLG